ncbi:universal stress protein [Geodermatophilus sp. SYSU D01180]
MTSVPEPPTAATPDATPRAAAGDRPVVAGVDGSREAFAAARLAAREARGRGTTLGLVLAVPAPAGRTRPPDRVLDAIEVLHTACGLVLDATAAELRRSCPGLTVAPRLVDGDAVEVLGDAAAGAQLLCLGTSGAGSARGLLLGSTAAAVLRAAPCPVAVVPLRARRSGGGRSGVVAGLDGGPASGAVLAEALRAAALRGTGVLAVHTWARGPVRPLSTAERLAHDDAAQRRAEALLDDLLAGAAAVRARWPDVPVSTVVRQGRAADTLVAAALTAELLVVGHRRHALPGRPLRSVTSAVVHAAGCPVLVVPAARPPGGQAAG